MSKILVLVCDLNTNILNLFIFSFQMTETYKVKSEALFLEESLILMLEKKYEETS